MNEYQELMAFLFKMENIYFDEKCRAIEEGDMEAYHYSLNKILKINEMKQYYREQYMD